jgi:hypothetical protein
MIPFRQPAPVWHTSGRRYLTLKAACDHEARLAARAKYPCECDPPDYETGYSYNCQAHEGIEGDPAGYEKLIARYARLLLRAARKQAKGGE